MNLDIALAILGDRRIGYAITDRQLRMVEIRDPAHLLSADRNPKLGSSLLDLMPELVGAEEVLEAILAGELASYKLEWVNRQAADGSTTYLTVIELPYWETRVRAGEISGVLHVVEDETEAGQLHQRLMQRRNELRLAEGQLAERNQQLTVANSELRHLDAMKSMFISVAAHELRTPLAAIRGYVELMVDGSLGQLSATQQNSLEVVHHSSQRLLTITNNLLDVTRIESGRVELILQPTDLVQLVRDVVAELEPVVRDRQQRVEVMVADGLPPALCDPVRAMQILGNLLSNASKYSPHQGWIGVFIEPASEVGYLQVAVQDAGIGIGEADQEKLFTRFFRAGTAHLTGATGAGLGLYITRSLVELHGGHIWLESVEGKGSTFYVTFSVAPGVEDREVLDL